MWQRVLSGRHAGLAATAAFLRQPTAHWQASWFSTCVRMPLPQAAHPPALPRAAPGGASSAPAHHAAGPPPSGSPRRSTQALQPAAGARAPWPRGVRCWRRRCTRRGARGRQLSAGALVHGRRPRQPRDGTSLHPPRPPQAMPVYPKEFTLRRLLVFLGIVIGCVRAGALPRLQQDGRGRATTRRLARKQPCREERARRERGTRAQCSKTPWQAGPARSPALTRQRCGALRPLVGWDGCVPFRYSCYYLTRNSLTYTAPVMVADPKLHMDITQIGAMTSIFPIA